MEMKKTIAAVLVAIIGISSLSFAVAYANASGPFNNGLGWGFGSQMRRRFYASLQRSWVRVNGIIETWGSQEVNGSLSVNARTTGFEEVLREVAVATAIWSNTTNFRERGNFSYSFYVARLREVNVTALNFDEEVDFFMNGTWNVFNVTISQTTIISGDLESHYTVERQTKKDVEPIATEAYGELNVTGNWPQFVLSIDGIDELNGVTTRAWMRQMMFNKFKISEDGTDKVTRTDLKFLAKNYGLMPGWGSFDSNMDFNCNYRIDIADLSTVAANVEA
jgi:hypothetical protein